MNKINLCQNETCSGNGLCKIQNENELNETIKCECFGQNSFEGEKCEIKSTKMIVRESTVKTTSIIAIVILIGLFSLAILSDIHSFYIKKHKPKKQPKPKQRRSIDVYVKLKYVP